MAKDWKKHAMNNIPGNWPGTKKQYEEYYGTVLDGLLGQVEEGFAKQFGELVRTAMVSQAEGGKATEKIDFNFTFDFNDLDIPSFTGKADVTEKRKHSVSLGFTKTAKGAAQGSLALSGDAATASVMDKTKDQEPAKKKTGNKGNPAGKKVKPAPSTKGSADEKDDKEAPPAG